MTKNGFNTTNYHDFNGRMNDYRDDHADYWGDDDLYMPERYIRDLIHSHGFQFVPLGKRTPEVCLAAVRHYGLALEFVPLEKRTPEVCLAAVQRNGLALQFVPPDERTYEACLAAVRQCGSALKWVQLKMKTPEMCLVAVENGGDYAFEWVPELLRTPTLRKLANKSRRDWHTR